ncbi:MAG: ArnT family glycosyltransferase [Chloroflexota bacterium]
MCDRGAVLAASIGLVCALALLVMQVSPELRLTLALLATGAIGVLGARLVLPSLDPGGTWDLLDAAILAGCIAIAAVTLITGIVVALPGPVPSAWLSYGIIVMLFGLTAAGLRAPHHRGVIQWITVLHVVLLIAVASPFRMVDLGYSEFQGDEASILHRASAIVQGVDAAILAHRKGPGEILFATYFGQLTGRVTESDARFPFAVVSVLSVLGVYCAGRAMFGTWAGLTGGLLWAINGYSVGFGRIVQYHSIMVLLTSLALLCAWRAEAVTPQRGALRRASVALLALGLAFGFNVVILGLPAMLLLGTSIGTAWRTAGWPGRAQRFRWADVLILLAMLAALVYVILEWRDMLRNLSERMGRGQPFNNFSMFASVTVRYVGQPYLLATIGASIIATAWLTYRSTSARKWGIIAAVAILVAVGALVATHAEPTWFAIGVWMLLTLPFLAPSGMARSWRVLGLSVLLPLGLYGFLLRQTGTHWYEAYPAMLLLLGGMSSQLFQSLSKHQTRALAVAGAAVVTIFGVYPVYTFLPLWPLDASMPAAEIYRPPWRAERTGGSFGFPHQDGLKAIALVHELRYMPMPYESNASPEVTRWYLPNSERCSRPRGSYITLFSERQPTRQPVGTDIWVITVRGAPEAVIRDQTATPRPLAQLAAEAPSTWFDERYARFERPLTVPRSLCSRTMRPSWQRN